MITGSRDPNPTRSHSLQLQSNNQIFRKYYEDNDIFLSPEGILKVLSVIACIISSALFLSGGSCAGAPWLVTGSATTALAVAAAVALLTACRALQLPLYAPQPWLYMDIIVPSVAGAVLLVTGVLSMTICEMTGALDYLHGPLAIAIAVMLVTSAAVTYSSAMRLWDEAAGPAVEPRAPPSLEHEV